MNTFYPSPRAAYNELLAAVFRDLGNPANRFLDPTGTSQLQNLQLFGTATLDGKTISTWAEVLPSGAVLLQDTLPCPGGYTQLADVDRSPRIAASPGGTGGTTLSDPPDTFTLVASGAGKKGAPGEAASSDHAHEMIAPFRAFVFCRRN